MKASFDIQDYEQAKKTFRIDVPKYFNFGFDGACIIDCVSGLSGIIYHSGGTNGHYG